jgi:hypothetical protein
MMLYRTIEAGGFGNMPRSVRLQGPLRKSERNRPDCEPATPRTLRSPRPEIDWNVDWRRGGGSAGWCRGRISDKTSSKSQSKRNFLGHVRSSKRLGRRFCRNRDFFKIKLLNKFSCNLRSKSVRSSLTSPSPIRVKRFTAYFKFPPLSTFSEDLIVRCQNLERKKNRAFSTAFSLVLLHVPQI